VLSTIFTAVLTVATTGGANAQFTATDDLAPYDSSHGRIASAQGEGELEFSDVERRFCPQLVEYKPTNRREASAVFYCAYVQGYVAWQAQDSQQALARYNQALNLLRSEHLAGYAPPPYGNLSHKELLGWLHFSIGRLHGQIEQTRAALKHMRAAWELLQRSDRMGDSYRIELAAELATLLEKQGKLDRAAGMWRSAISVFDRYGAHVSDQCWTGWYYVRLADVMARKGQWQKAYASYEQGAQRCRSRIRANVLAPALRGMARASAKLGQWSTSRQALERLLVAYDAFPPEPFELKVNAVLKLAAVTAKLGNDERAQRLRKMAKDMIREPSRRVQPDGSQQQAQAPAQAVTPHSTSAGQ